MKSLVLVLSGTCMLWLFSCSPAPVKLKSPDDTGSVPAVKDTAVPAAVISTLDAISSAEEGNAADSVAPEEDTSLTRHNDTAVIRQILDECGLLSVKPEQVTEWDSSGRAVGLDLTNKDMSKYGITAIPAAICSLTELRSLEVKDNVIAALPSELFMLKKLVKLDVAGNKITFIPSSIAELENLEVLDLRYNGFGYLPSEIRELKQLVSLQLWGNRMVELDSAVTELPALKELYLKDNRLTSLPEGITRMKSLVYYDLQGNAICNPSPKVDAWLKKKDKRYRETQKCR